MVWRQKTGRRHKGCARRSPTWRNAAPRPADDLKRPACRSNNESDWRCEPQIAEEAAGTGKRVRWSAGQIDSLQIVREFFPLQARAIPGPGAAVEHRRGETAAPPPAEGRR